MRGKIIRRLLNRLVTPEGVHVSDQKIEVNRVWMIEVLPYSVLER